MPPKTQLRFRLVETEEDFYAPFALFEEDDDYDDDFNHSWQEVAMLKNCKDEDVDSVHLRFDDDSCQRFVDEYCPDEGYNEYEICLEWLTDMMKNVRSLSVEPVLPEEPFFTIHIHI